MLALAPIFGSNVPQPVPWRDAMSGRQRNRSHRPTERANGLDARHTSEAMKRFSRAVTQQMLAFSPTPQRTIAQAVERFLAEEMLHVKASTRRRMELYLHRIERAVGRRSVNSNFREVAIGWRSSEAPTAAAAMAELLNRLERCSLRWGWRSEEPDLHGLCSTKSRTRDRIFTLRQRVELLRYCSRPATARRRVCLDAIRFLVHSGWRASEACSIEWANVDRDESTIYLADTKTGPQYRVIGPEALAVIEAQPRVGPWVFPHRKGSGPLNYKSLSWEFSLARAELGLVGLCLHSLRHDFCSRAAQLHLSPKFVASLVGHSAEWQLSTYVHPSRDDLRETASRIDAAFVAVTAGRQRR